MLHSSGQPARDYVDQAVRHVYLRQGVLGIKVKIMKAWDPEGLTGPTKPLPDMVTIVEPKEEAPISAPISDSKVQELAQPQTAPAAQVEATREAMPEGTQSY